MQEDLVAEKFGGVDGRDTRVVGDLGQLVNAAQLDQGRRSATLFVDQLDRKSLGDPDVGSAGRPGH